VFQAILWTNALMSRLKSRPLVPYEDYLQRQRRKVKIDLMRRHELQRSARARWAAKRRRQPCVSVVGQVSGFATGRAEIACGAQRPEVLRRARYRIQIGLCSSMMLGTAFNISSAPR
jgi:hypothetical protein